MRNCIVLSLALILALTASAVSSEKLEVIPDPELEKLIEQEDYVVVLFAPTEDDEPTKNLETQLSMVREDLVDSLNAWVVKAVHSPLKARYTPDKEPVVVFFRKQNPVLYDGPANEEEILETIFAYREPCTKDLIDGNFEHLTQAATGATTGDWFVFFYRDDCDKCRKMRARLETVACKMRGKVNVARINRESSGAITGRRFGVVQVPEIIFFRLGKMYRYSIEKYDVESMISFISGWYKNVKAENIPLPKSPFDDLVVMCADYLRENPITVSVAVAVPLILGLAFYFLTKSDEDEDDSNTARTKKKKKKVAKKDKSKAE